MANPISNIYCCPSILQTLRAYSKIIVQLLQLGLYLLLATGECESGLHIKEKMDRILGGNPLFVQQLGWPMLERMAALLDDPTNVR